jgi:hypothetical protein
MGLILNACLRNELSGVARRRNDRAPHWDRGLKPTDDPEMDVYGELDPHRKS